MFTAKKSRLALGAAVLAGVTVVAAGCASSDPLAPETDAPAAGDTIVIGSQAYYSNEIIAEIYAQALEDAGFEVSRDAFNSGQRDAYIPALEAGEITCSPSTRATCCSSSTPRRRPPRPTTCTPRCRTRCPRVSACSTSRSATDQDSYNVTAEFADENSLVAIGDLGEVSTPLTLGGAPELEERPYGPTGPAGDLRRDGRVHADR